MSTSADDKQAEYNRQQQAAAATARRVNAELEQRVKERAAEVAQQLRTSSPDDDPEAIAKARGAAVDRQLVALEAAQLPQRKADLFDVLDEVSVELQSKGVAVSYEEFRKNVEQMTDEQLLAEAEEVGAPFGEVAGHTMARERLIDAIRNMVNDPLVDGLPQYGELREAAEAYFGGDFSAP